MILHGEKKSVYGHEPAWLWFNEPLGGFFSYLIINRDRRTFGQIVKCKPGDTIFCIVFFVVTQFMLRTHEGK